MMVIEKELIRPGPFSANGREGTRPMPIAESRGIWKRFGDRDVVQDVSFSVDAGEVLGVVGPNGAGKTTTMRMLLDIIRPDQGDVLIFGEPFDHAHRAMLGYLPEERGLYRDLRVGETLEYLGALKGMRRSDARSRSVELLDRLGMAEHRDKKVQELSKGMAQLIQLAATFLHRPRLLVLDEPFSGLDPVNLRLVKEVLVEQQKEGVAVMLSTHQMSEVEELCSRVLMINAGRVVLYGDLEEVRESFGGRSIVVESTSLPDVLPGVDTVNNHGHYRELVMSEGAESRTVFQALAEAGVDVKRFEVAGLPLEDIFIQVVKGTQA